MLTFRAGPPRFLGAAASVLATGALVLAGCGGSSSSSSSPKSTSSTGAGPAPSSSAGGSSAGALSAEARSAATGDIPDNQNFLTFHNTAVAMGYSIIYPEGWTQKGSAGDITFQDKNNVVHIVVSSGPPPTTASATSALARERSRLPSLQVGAPTTVQIGGAPVIKVSYSTISAPNPVTGKRVQLLVDRYEFARAGKVAVLDLASPKGVDNVDAYRRMSHSFRWL
ncbi:MAG TPA: hypothetical protein VGY97_13755 [Solirubrobacteraceae bacterium]|nr:hypothetical protein [Solirubrobacteraceae bacterium]